MEIVTHQQLQDEYQKRLNQVERPVAYVEYYALYDALNRAHEDGAIRILEKQKLLTPEDDW